MSAGVGVLMSLGAGRAHLSWQGLESTAAQMVSLLFLPPFAVLGGWLAGRIAQHQASRRAPLQVPLAIQPHRAFLWLAFFLGLGMTAAGAWIVSLGGEEELRVGWSAVLFFGGATLFLGWSGLRNKPHTILREDGIKIAAWRVVIPWSEIVDAAASRPHPIEYVRLRVHNPERYLSRLTPFQHAMTQTGESEPNIGIALSGTPYKAEEICALVRSQVRGWRV